MPQSSDLSDHRPWLESQRRSRARRFRALRARRRGRWLRSGLGILAASLTVAGGALASGGVTSSSSVTTSGVSVATIQRALAVPADGIVGPKTRWAIKYFQRNHGLTPDGIVGPATLAALGLSHTTSRTLASTSAPSSELAKIAACESNGNPTAVSRDGVYRGKYQFRLATWRWLGGTGDPAAAPEATQDAMAAKLLSLRGTSPWPVCG